MLLGIYKTPTSTQEEICYFDEAFVFLKAIWYVVQHQCGEIYWVFSWCVNI